MLGADQVVLPKAEFESICEQLTKLKLETIGVWAGRHDEVDGLERILIPLHAALPNLETAVELETESTEVQP